jgi:hypothetical protein
VVVMVVVLVEGNAQQNQEGAITISVYVANLRPDATVDLLYRLFMPFGPIASAKVVMSDDNPPICKVVCVFLCSFVFRSSIGTHISGIWVCKFLRPPRRTKRARSVTSRPFPASFCVGD